MREAPRFGFYAPLSSRVGLSRLLRETADEVTAAERWGFSSFLIGEHHQQRFDVITSPLMVAGFLAARTERMHVGTGLLLPPLYHPVHIAEDVAMLDVLSGGRAVLGVGVGYQQVDFSAFGVPFEERVQRFEEAIEVVRHCWTGEPFSFEGRFLRLENVRIRPRPLQEPGPPILVGAWSAAGIRRAAELGDGWLVDPIQGLPAVAEMARLYRSETERLGKRPRVVLIREAWVAPTRQQALDEYGPAALAVYRYYWQSGAFSERYDPWIREVSGGEELTVERFARDRFLLGTPGELVEQIERWRAEAGVDEIILALRHPTGPDHEQVLGAIELFGREVIRRLV